MLRKIKLANARNSGREVWLFSTSGRKNLYMDVVEKSLDQRDLVKDKPHTWYLLEDPADRQADPYVFGIGKDVTVLGPGGAIKLNVLEESELFDREFMLRPVRDRAARSDQETAGHLSGKKLRQVVEELAARVSYKTIRTVLRRVAPEGVDPTIKVMVQFDDTVREVRLVLYAIQKKHLSYFGTVGGGEEPEMEDENVDQQTSEAALEPSFLFEEEPTIEEESMEEEPIELEEKTVTGKDTAKRITHMVGVWTESGELVDAYWASARPTIDGALELIHQVATMLQKGQEPGMDLMQALLDTEAPTTRFNYVDGEYGAAVRLAVSQDYERDREVTSTEALSDISTNIVSLVADAAHIGIDIAAEEGINALNGFFGASLEEPDENQIEVTEPKVKVPQPYTKLKGVYDQRPRSICVLCSIGAAMSIVANITPKTALDAITEVIPAATVPRSGLVMSETFRKLEGARALMNLKWRRISPSVDSMKRSLDAGIPVVVGTIFDGGIFKYKSNLDTPLAGPSGMEMMHCVTLVGYDDADSTFTFLNSWGPQWGRDGAMHIEQDYQGFDRAFVLLPEDTSKFGAVDISPNLPSVSFSET